MGEKVTVDSPDQWRQHLVEAAPEVKSPLALRHCDEDEFQLPMMSRVDVALEDIHQQCGIMSVHEEEWPVDLQNLAGNEVVQVILAACIKHQVTPDTLLNGLSQSMRELD